MANSALSPHTYTMSQVKVHFPCKAYPSQLAMMNNIIRGLQKGQNALLESPTGSGKSLALLCASLAWQTKETEDARAYNAAVENGQIEPEFVEVRPDQLGEDDDGSRFMTEDELMHQKAIDLACEESAKTGAGFVRFHDDDDDDFVDGPPSKRIKSDETRRKEVQPPPPPVYNAAEVMVKKIKKKTVPKIYFGTRTHKQITQIIRELNKTPYKDAKMTILGSRDHTCIHPVVSKMKSRNEGCKELNDRTKGGGGCSYQQNVKSKLNSHSAINAYKGSRDAWDLEDLVKVGKKVKACPYYATRELKPKSQIIFCPYNYLVEPLIRKSMEISLKGQIVILDEAHNIEDSARSAASWQVTQEEIRDAMKDIENLLAMNATEHGGFLADPEAHQELASMCSHLASWIDNYSNDLGDYKNFTSSAKVWTGTEIVAIFNVHGIGQDRYNDLKTCMEKVHANWADKDLESREKEGEKPSLHSNTMGVLEGFFMVLNFLYMEGMKHRDDYRVAITKTQVRKQFKEATEKGPLGKWMGKNRGHQSQSSGSSVHKFTFTANFWCLNPAVTFTDIKEETHSIVLTSGTLSPMASFSSELDVKFPLMLEANHVIDKKQVYISTLSHGPTGHSLNATYKNAETYGFQDEIGRLTLRVCQTISHGVLLFLPSYSMLNKLSDRWRENGLWEQIGMKKVIISEPRFSDEFESSIRHFYDVIEETNDKEADYPGVNGALFIAVCRGKVSEGLDFADNNARAVICVGIPFPNVKDIQVDLKKKYNDGRRHTNKNILSGNDWYEIQAFRALNQALGRCIRHRKDWGAILMVDDRYAKIKRYLGSLSKWVRSGVVHHSNCNQMLGALTQFSENMKTLDEDMAKADAAAEAKRISEELERSSSSEAASGSASKLKQKIEAEKSEAQSAAERMERVKADARLSQMAKRAKTEAKADTETKSAGDPAQVKTEEKGVKPTEKSDVKTYSGRLAKVSVGAAEIKPHPDRMNSGFQMVGEFLKDSKAVNTLHSNVDLKATKNHGGLHSTLPTSGTLQPLQRDLLNVRASGNVPNKTVGTFVCKSENLESKDEKAKTVIPESSDESEVEEVLFDDDDDFNEMVNDIIPEKNGQKQKFKFDAICQPPGASRADEPGNPPPRDSKPSTLSGKLSKLSSKKRPIQYADSDDDFE